MSEYFMKPIKVEMPNIINGYYKNNWHEMTMKIREGKGPLYYPVGSELPFEHDVYTGNKWIVMGHDQVPSATGKTHTMTLLARDCLANFTFNPSQALYYCDAVLPAGTYNFTLTSNPWYAGDAGKTFQFTLANAAAKGSQLFLNGIYNQTLTGKTIRVYASESSTEILETATISEGSEGTSLGTIGEGSLNHIQRIFFGSSNYKESTIRQFLLSSGDANSYWVPQVKFDRYASLPKGFMAGFSEDFLEAVDTAIVKCSSNSVYEAPDSSVTKGGTYQLLDKFWLPSRMEIYNSSDIADGSSYMQYWTGKTNTDRIKTLNGAARYWWLRTPHSSHAYNVRVVYTGGSLDNGYAYGSSGCVPACIIA